MVKNGAIASTMMVRSQPASASLMSAMGPKMPAALTRMVGAPKRRLTASPRRLTAVQVRDVAGDARDRARGSRAIAVRLLELVRAARHGDDRGAARPPGPTRRRVQGRGRRP